jgi:hypothetical protein
MAGSNGPGRSVRSWRREVLRLASPESLPLLFGIEGPVLGHVVPDVPLQVVGVVFHHANSLDQWEQILFILFP